MTGLSSGIYRGWVRHRRRAPVVNSFRYRLFMLYLDLDELDAVFARRWLWSVERRNLASFRREDFLGDPTVPLRDAVLDAVERDAGRRPNGAVRMLTHLRYFGYSFNPVTFYYCFDGAGELDAVVAEITNTPWLERHRYVLVRDRDTDSLTARFDKRFHVSPFMAMEQEYAWRFSVPGESLTVQMENHESGRGVFGATLELERREITGGELAKALIRHPWMTGKVWVGIYFQALKLWLKRAPFHSHPRLSEAS